MKFVRLLLRESGAESGAEKKQATAARSQLHLPNRCDSSTVHHPTRRVIFVTTSFGGCIPSQNRLRMDCCRRRCAVDIPAF